LLTSIATPYLAAGLSSPGVTALPINLAVPTTVSVATPAAVVPTDTAADPTATAAEPTAAVTATTAQPEIESTRDSTKSIRIEIQF
jgi:hypothetical protein